MSEARFSVPVRPSLGWRRAVPHDGPIPLTVGEIVLVDGFLSTVVTKAILLGTGALFIGGALSEVLTRTGHWWEVLIMVVVGVPLLLAGWFVRRSEVVLGPRGISMGDLGGAQRPWAPWPCSRTGLYCVQDRHTSDAGEYSYEVWVVRADGSACGIHGLTWESRSPDLAEQACVEACNRIWAWAVARGYTRETGEYVPINSLVASLQAEREDQEARYRLR